MRFLLASLLLGICTVCSTASAQAVQALPATVADDTTLWLECGQTYSGELKLLEARRVTVRTAGTCGKATLTPARPVKHWTRDPRQPQIWVAALPTKPLQVQLGDTFIAEAHHPNSAVQWLQGKRLTLLQLTANIPNADLAGATIVWRAADWLLQSRPITHYEAGVLSLESGDDEGFGLLATTEFYVEGKRWMLDAPGEWAWQDGVLSVWPPDGLSPEGRAWASVAARAIDARGSREVSIINVRMVGASVAVDGRGSEHLQVLDTEILNSAEAALLLGSGAQVQNVWVKGSRQHGLLADLDAHGILVSDSRFDDIGMLGMPRRSKGAIVFEQARDVVVERNRISRASYLGIRIFRAARVAENVIQQACLRLSDCGGIYTFARDRQPLDTVIERNRVVDLAGRSAYGIYLDDFANGVRVVGNHLENNGGGIQLHNGFQNEIRANRFVNNRYEQMLFNETAPFASISGNQIHDNQFLSTRAIPVYRLWSRHGGAHVKRFADFRGNAYQHPPAGFAEVEGVGMLDLSRWRQQFADEQEALRSDSKRPIKQDALRSGSVRAPQLDR